MPPVSKLQYWEKTVNPEKRRKLLRLKVLKPLTEKIFGVASFFNEFFLGGFDLFGKQVSLDVAQSQKKIGVIGRVAGEGRGGPAWSI